MRKGHDVNFKTARLVGNISQPFAIGRERRLYRHELPVLHNRERFSVSAPRDGPNLSAGRPIRSSAFVRRALLYAAAALEREIFSIGRPSAKKFRLVILTDQWSCVAGPVGGLLIKVETSKMESPLLIRNEAHFPIRRPECIGVDSRLKSDPRFDAAREVIHPDVRFARA